MSFSLSALETKANARNRQAKAQPKSAAVTKNGAAGASTRGKGARGRGGRNPRPAKKTAEELDSEMADYWESGANAAGAETGATNGAAAANGDAAMDDEIL
jgi:THO complex subunit 4